MARRRECKILSATICNGTTGAVVAFGSFMIFETEGEDEIGNIDG
jgi:hypothetical protein